MATIYSITSTKGNKVYIGSTTNYPDRIRHHGGKANNCNSKILFEEYGKENCIFNILEECPVEQRYERERFHIDNTPNNINGKRPNITTEEDNQRRYASKKEWVKKNPDKAREIDRRKYVKNREIILENAKKYYEENKDELNRKRREARQAKKESATI